MNRFAEHHDLRGGFLFNRRVVAIDASANGRSAMLSTATTGLNEKQAHMHVESHGPFDLVIFASIASEPHVPHLPNSGAYFQSGGEQLHASECSHEVLTRLIAEQKRIAVVGGSKSAADVVLALDGSPGSCCSRT